MIGKSINFLHQVCHDQTPTAKMIAVTKSAESPQDGMMVVVVVMVVVTVMTVVVMGGDNSSSDSDNDDAYCLKYFSFHRTDTFSK